MKRIIRTLLVVFVLTLTACSTGIIGDSGEKEFPTEAIQIIAPATAGGGWDAAARAMQQIYDR